MSTSLYGTINGNASRPLFSTLRIRTRYFTLNKRNCTARAISVQKLSYLFTLILSVVTWDPKITTYPGLYLFTSMYHTIATTLIGKSISCSVGFLRFFNVIILTATFFMLCCAHRKRMVSFFTIFVLMCNFVTGYQSSHSARAFPILVPNPFFPLLYVLYGYHGAILCALTPSKSDGVPSRAWR